LSIQIQMLGTGSAFAKKYYNNNALLYSNGYTAMLDCGSTAPWSLHQLGRTFADIHALLISHIHADHIGGMEEFAFKMKFVYKRLPLLYLPEPLIEPLWNNSLKGGLWQEEQPALEHYFEIKPLYAGEETEIIPGLIVEPIRTQHINGKQSFSYLLNRTFFYSADMKFDPVLLQALSDQGCATFFHDCQLQGPGEVHTTLEQLRSLPEEIQYKTWLMHYDDSMDEHVGHTGAMRFVQQHERYSFE